MENKIKIIGKIILTVSLTLFTFCNPQTKIQPKNEIWENIQKAVFNRDLDYLLSISADTLDCIECNEGKSKVTKENFFNNYIEEIDFLKDKEYRTFLDEIKTSYGSEKRYRVNYQFTNSNTICTILEGNGKIVFKGCFTIP